MLTRQKNYEKLAAADMESRWEIHEGELREKPSMSYLRGHTMVYLGGQLFSSLTPPIMRCASRVAV